MSTVRRSLTFWVLPLFLFVVAMVAALPRTKAAADVFTATRTRTGLSLAMPYHASHAGAGKLNIELLDPEDKVLAHSERELNVASGDGVWHEELALQKPMALDDLVWERVRYRFTYNGEADMVLEETRSVSEILRRPVVHILGQSSYLAGSEAAIRVILSDSTGQQITGNSNMKVELLADGHAPRSLFFGHINQHGTMEAQFRFPAGLIRNYQLHFIADTPLGNAEATEPVRIEDKVSILLTTEKPIYQPGQTIHVRALALDRADHHAAAGKLTFEIEDSRGNKVFKKATEADGYGIASAEFALADEVNFGTYHLRALMGDPQTPTNTAEIALNVQRYVLPKFKVAVEFAAKDGKPKRDYRPGDHVIGTVHANYFFGQPVNDSEVAVKASGMDVEVNDFSTKNGKTDKSGDYHFDLMLPKYFTGTATSGGAAPVLIEATVKDTSGHAETKGEPVTVSESSLLVTAIPEGGALIPGLENQLFVLTSYADGSPASASLVVHATGTPEQRITTDKSGVAVMKMVPEDNDAAMQVEADDHHGNRVSKSVPLSRRYGADQVLLRTDRAVYKAGDRMSLQVYSTQENGSAYIDIVKDGQTILTRDVDVVNGRAQLSVTATPDMAGSLDVNVYRFGSDAQAIGDHRLLFVQPAEELKIEATSDAREYKPGAEARIRFRVTDGRGQGVHAALGLQIVDEAVFALAEKQPGFAKVFFYLEQEMMKPRYEIHSLSMSNAVEPQPDADAHNRDVQALFAATETVNPNRLDTEFGRDVPQTKADEYKKRYQDRFNDQVTTIAKKLSDELNRHPSENDLPTIFTAMLHNARNTARDSWGSELSLQPVGWWGGRGKARYYRVVSAGADRKMHTSDDLFGTIETTTGTFSSASGVAITMRMEHDRGPANGLSEVAGIINDPSGAVISNASVTVSGMGTSRKTKSNAAGNFSIPGLQVGTYDVEVSSPGFQTASRRVTLQARDRAVLTTVLSVGQVSQTVMVAAQPEVIFEALPMRARAMGGAFAEDRAAPAPMAQMEQVAVENAVFKASPKPPAPPATGAPAAALATHVRSYFPEALYINPEIITDGNGSASITVPIADSITTWRMAMLASTKKGALGTGTSSLKVFQDFFIDLDLPVALTQGDRVSIPVAIYNYAGEHGDVQLKLQPDAWFSLVDDSAEKSVAANPGQVGGAQFTVQANKIGRFKLTLSARMKGKAQRKDIVVREIEVVPNGQQKDLVFNGRLDATGQASVQQNVRFSEGAIPDASKLFVRLYPGPLSQVIEGMDSILRMPGGCFEQTSSSTYPNVLALDYMKRTKKLSPEVHAKAEGFIANGYQRLLTFEVPGGGFSWFGQAPANKILTSYGLMEFSDMSKVHDVDPKLITRTRDWLISQQQADGSWKPDTQFINEGATNRFNTDLVRITAYIAWALENTGYQGSAVDKAKNYLQSHANAKVDAYTLAVLANFAVDYGKDAAFKHDAIQKLLNAKNEGGDQAWWTSSETGVYSTGVSAAIETTGLAVQALLKSHEAVGTTRKALSYIAVKKDAEGTWGTTQATIMALRALLLASAENGADVRGNVKVTLNGSVVETLQLTPENNDLFHQLVLPANADGANDVRVQFEGKGSLAYQVVGRYFMPWETKPTEEALAINVAYDRTKLARNDIVAATATVRNNLTKTANMVMVDLGIPPGFDLLSEDLQTMQEKTAGQKAGKLEKFSLTATQAILYFTAFAPKSTAEIHFRLRAKYPIRAKTFQSKVYEYYDPAVSAVTRPVQLEVSAK